jgi:hypothetical protein
MPFPEMRNPNAKKYNVTKSIDTKVEKEMIKIPKPVEFKHEDLPNTLKSPFRVPQKSVSEKSLDK